MAQSKCRHPRRIASLQTASVTSSGMSTVIATGQYSSSYAECLLRNLTSTEAGNRHGHARRNLARLGAEYRCVHSQFHSVVFSRCIWLRPTRCIRTELSSAVVDSRAGFSENKGAWPPLVNLPTVDKYLMLYLTSSTHVPSEALGNLALQDLRILNLSIGYFRRSVLSALIFGFLQRHCSPEHSEAEVDHDGARN